MILKLNSFAKHDLVKIIELIYETTFIDTEQKLNVYLEKLSQVLPFECATCAIVDLQKDGTYKQLKNIIKSSFPADWQEYYAKNNLDSIDPYINRAFHQYKSFRWSDIAKSPLLVNPSTKKYLKIANEFGLSQGISHGFRSQIKPIGTYISFSGAKLELDHSFNQLLDFIAPFFHNILTQSLKKKEHNKPLLSKREMDVLMWLKEGKTNWEISCILQISESTVKYHLENIYQKLNVGTRSGAVAAAISAGLIEI